MFLYLFFFLVYINLEKLYNRLNLDSQARTFKYITKFFFDKIYNFKLYIYHDIQRIKKYDNILLICNHINFIDNMVLIRYCLQYFPEYSIHFVFGKSLYKIPFINEFINKYHIFAYELNYEYLIYSKLDRIEGKKIIILFPEGKLLIARHKDKSLEYCKLNNIELNYLLCPYKKGFDILKNYCDIIIDSTILYSNSDNLAKINIYGNYDVNNLDDDPYNVVTKLPKCIHIFTRILDKNSDIINIWSYKDKYIYNIINKKKIFIPIKIINEIDSMLLSYLCLLFIMYYF